MRFVPLLQYFCSSCRMVLKESYIIEFQKEQLKEECPGCGALLIDNLQNRRLSSASTQEQQLVTDTNQKPIKHLPFDFQTAYRQIEDSSVKFAFDINKIDSLLNLDAHGSICIIGEQNYTQILLDRLCVHSMLPKRHGGMGLGYSKIVVIDAGNCTDVYQIVAFARQYGLETRKVLQNMVVSRVFTIYQLASLIVYKLPTIVKQLSSDNKIIVIYGLLHLFVSDPHIDKEDAKQLIKEIASWIRKLSEDRFVLVSFAHCNSEYEKLLLRAFDNYIEVTNDADDSGALQIDVYNRNNTTNRRGSRANMLAKLRKSEMLLVPAR